MKNLLKKSSYVRTEILHIRASHMDPALALASALRERYTADGNKIDGDNALYAYPYTLRKKENHWKIVVAMAHDPEKMI